MLLFRKHKKSVEIKGSEGNIYWDFYENSVEVYKSENKQTIQYNEL